MTTNGRRRLAAVATMAALTLAGCNRGGTTVDASASTSTTTAAGTSTTTATSGGGLGRIAPSAANDFLSGSASSIGDITSGTFTLTATVADNPVLGPGDQEVLVIQGAFDETLSLSRFEVDVSGLSSVAPEVILADEKDPTARQVLSAMFAQPVVVLVDGNEQYLGSKVLSALIGGGRNWMRTERGDRNVDLAGMFGRFDLDSIESLLDGLGRAGDVEQQGREEIGGIEAVRFHIEADFAALDSAGSGDLLGDLGQGTGTIDIWVDDEDIVRRVEIRGDTSMLEAAFDTPVAGAAASFTFDLTGLGDDVAIETPTPSDVFDALERDPSTPTTLPGVAPTTAGPSTTAGWGSGAGPSSTTRR